MVLGNVWPTSVINSADCHFAYGIPLYFALDEALSKQGFLRLGCVGRCRLTVKLTSFAALATEGGRWKVTCSYPVNTNRNSYYLTMIWERSKAISRQADSGYGSPLLLWPLHFSIESLRPLVSKTEGKQRYLLLFSITCKKWKLMLKLLANASTIFSFLSQ